MEKKLSPDPFGCSPSSGGRINRRELVQRLLGGAAAGIGLPAIAASHPVHKHLLDSATRVRVDAQAAAPDWKPAFLDAHQNETVIVLAEKIVPGATRAQVNRFIDLALGAESQENQQKFLNALAAFEARSLERFGNPFQDLSEAQQIELLSEASTAPPGETARPRGKNWITAATKSSSRPARVTLRDHFENLKGWTSGAYYSSEIGLRELGWTGDQFFESFPGCDHSSGHR